MPHGDQFLWELSVDLRKGVSGGELPVILCIESGLPCALWSSFATTPWFYKGSRFKLRLCNYYIELKF